MKFKNSIMWFRRDLRLEDNTALSAAIAESENVFPIFIFDRNILHHLPPDDRRVSFIWESLESMNECLAKKNAGTIHYTFGKPDETISQIISQNKINAVFCNHDYEPAAIQRDDRIRRLCERSGVAFHTYKDQVVFEKSEIIKSDGSPYKIFTAYKNAWQAQLEQQPDSFLDSQPFGWKKIKRLNTSDGSVTRLDQIGFNKTGNIILGGESEAISGWKSFSSKFLADYEKNRDLPGVDKTSHLSPYLRFGNISIRRLVRQLKDQKAKGAQVFLSELIWREFFMMILFHFPHVVKSAFNAQYDNIPWQNRKDWFKQWCQGETGFPIVDAGMRQLNETGFMHNRVRMITASFLVKHLHIDWRWGEKYFAEKLLDFELSSNNGNWQWAAGTGVDAAPYFRILNPVTQSKKFDPQGIYIKRWVKELRGCEEKFVHDPHRSGRETLIKNYPPPNIDLNAERLVCLQLYDQRSPRK
jgi:deoxyribodipyrimidine photo-lyase